MIVLDLVTDYPQETVKGRFEESIMAEHLLVIPSNLCIDKSPYHKAYGTFSPDKWVADLKSTTIIMLTLANIV